MALVLEELYHLREEGVAEVFLSDTVHEALLAKRRGDETPGRAAKRPAASESPQLAAASQELERAMDKAPPTDPSPPREQPRPATEATAKSIPSEPASFQVPEADPETQLAWLRERVESCPVCHEHLRPGGKIVFGSGAAKANIFFCGEAPGADEERQGEPFVGKAGQLLTKIIRAMGLEREDVYIANILKWRPEHDKPSGNRPPNEAEMRFCLPYLKAQLSIVQPKAIVALGNSAITGLFGHDPKRRLGSVRGTWKDFDGTPTILTFHPSYLLRNDTAKTKRMAWEDMLQVMEYTGLTITERQRGYFL